MTFALYGSIFAAGYAAALLVIRAFAPRADPALFPSAAVLVGLGFAMIFRLSGGLAAEQATWIAVGLLAFGLTLIVVRDHRMLDAYTYTIGLARPRAAAAAGRRRASAGRSTARSCG